MQGLIGFLDGAKFSEVIMLFIIIVLVVLLGGLVITNHFQKREIRKITSQVDLSQVPVKGQVYFRVNLLLGYNDGTFRGIEKIEKIIKTEIDQEKEEHKILNTIGKNNANSLVCKEEEKQ